MMWWLRPRGIPAVQAIATGAYSATLTNADDMWTRNYTAIRNATVFIVHINRVPMIEKVAQRPAGPRSLSQAKPAF